MWFKMLLTLAVHCFIGEHPAVYHCTVKLFSQTTGSDTQNDLRIQNSAKNGRTPINKLDRSHFITSKTKVCHAFKRKLILNKISHLLGQSPSLLDRYSTELSFRMNLTDLHCLRCVCVCFFLFLINHTT